MHETACKEGPLGTPKVFLYIRMKGKRAVPPNEQTNHRVNLLSAWVSFCVGLTLFFFFGGGDAVGLSTHDQFSCEI